MSDTSTTDLIQQGLTAARVGDVEDARRLLTEATQQRPDSIEAWLGLAGVVESLEEKKRCFEKVLALEPANGDAKAGLAIVETKLMASQDKIPDQVKSDSDGREATVVSEVVEPTVQSTTDATFCYRHPQIETGLRCNRCNQLICPKCAHRTPVGFRCPDCIREQEDKYYSGGGSDYVIAAVVAFPLSLIAAGLFTAIVGRFWFFFALIIGFIVAPIAAGFIAEAVRWAVRRRRSRYLARVVAACLILGTAPFILLPLLSGSFFGLIAPGIFLFLGTTTVLARLR